MLKMPYKIISTPVYLKTLTKFLKKHPDMRQRYFKAIKILEADPFHPSLRLHKLKGKMQIYYSVSITMKYRIIIDFVIQNHEIIPLDIGIHDDVY